MLVYSTEASDVELVVVDGAMVMANGRVLTLDESAIRAEVERYRRRLAPAGPDR